MTRRPPLVVASETVPLEQLAATAQMLAEALAAAAQCDSLSLQRRPRLQLVGAHDSQRAGDASLSTQVRNYLRARRLRDGLFPQGIFADPAWDMLLDLFACRLEESKVYISDACIAASVPQTTALRWVDRLEECGLVERHPDAADSRRIYVELTETAAWRIELWLNATFHADAAA